MTNSLSADFSASQANAVTPASLDPSVVPATTIAPPEKLSKSRLAALGFLGGACLLVAAPVVYMGSSATADFRAAAGVLTSNVETVSRAARNLWVDLFPQKFAPLTVVDPTTGSLTRRSEVEFQRLLAEISKGRCRGVVIFVGNVPYTWEGARVNDIGSSVDVAEKIAARLRRYENLPAHEVIVIGAGSENPLRRVPTWSAENFRVEASCGGRLSFLPQALPR